MILDHIFSDLSQLCLSSLSECKRKRRGTGACCVNLRRRRRSKTGPPIRPITNGGRACRTLDQAGSIFPSLSSPFQFANSWLAEITHCIAFCGLDTISVSFEFGALEEEQRVPGLGHM